MSANERSSEMVIFHPRDFNDKVGSIMIQVMKLAGYTSSDHSNVNSIEDLNLDSATDQPILGAAVNKTEKGAIDLLEAAIRQGVLTSRTKVVFLVLVDGFKSAGVRGKLINLLDAGNALCLTASDLPTDLEFTAEHASVVRVRAHFNAEGKSGGTEADGEQLTAVQRLTKSLAERKESGA